MPKDSQSQKTWHGHEVESLVANLTWEWNLVGCHWFEVLWTQEHNLVHARCHATIKKWAWIVSSWWVGWILHCSGRLWASWIKKCCDVGIPWDVDYAIVFVQFQMGDLVVLLNPNQQWVIAIGIISRIGGQGCVHHGTPIVVGWFQV
jgi:hypothetical protein